METVVNQTIFVQYYGMRQMQQRTRLSNVLTTIADIADLHKTATLTENDA